MSEIKEILASCFLFQGLMGEEVDILVTEYAKLRNFRKGELVCGVSSEARGIGLIVKGKAQVKQGEVVLNNLGAGEIFGVASLFSSEGYVSDIFASEGSQVLFISEENLLEILKKDFRVAENYIKFLTEKVRFLNAKIESFTAQTTTGKLAKYILKNADERGRLVGNSSAVELSKVLALGRASLYRAIDELVEGGSIEKRERDFFILDRKKLSEYR